MSNQIFIQARLASTRLPRKVVKEIDGRTVIEYLIERVKKVKNIDKIVLATGSREENKRLVRIAKDLKIDYFQGSEDNVLDRFYQASLEFSPDNIIRITGDCPLMDFNLINRGLEMFQQVDCDILSNCRTRTYPRGMDFEIFKVSALKKAWRDKSEELGNKFLSTFVNPTSYLLNSNKFKNKDFINNKESFAHIRLTLDYPEDLELIKIIFQNLYSKNKYFTLQDILEFLKINPHLPELNNEYIKLKYRLKSKK